MSKQRFQRLAGYRGGHRQKCLQRGEVSPRGIVVASGMDNVSKAGYSHRMLVMVRGKCDQWEKVLDSKAFA